MIRVGFLGLGEAGSLIAADLAAAGVEVRAWEPVVHECDGVEITAAAADVADGAQVVVSVNSAHDAMDAARSVVDRLGPEHLYADLNTAAPGEALAAGTALGCEEWLREDLARTLATADADTFEHLVTGSRRHAVRRQAEMAAAVAMLEELGVAPRVAAASEAWLGELAAEPSPR